VSVLSGAVTLLKPFYRSEELRFSRLPFPRALLAALALGAFSVVNITSIRGILGPAVLALDAIQNLIVISTRDPQ